MKENHTHAVIVLAKCMNKHNAFGIRLEEHEPGIWVATWAFPINESVSHKEKYYNNKILGTIQFDESYPGCPYCKSTGFILCGNCNIVACYKRKTELVCPACNKKLDPSGHIDHFNAGEDR